MAGGEHAKRLAVVRIDGDRLLEQGLRDHVVLARHPPVVRQRPHHQVPGVHAVRRLAPGAEILRGVELRLDRGDDRLGDLVLHREHVGEVAVVALRPDVAAGGDVVELRRDAHALAVLAHAAFDHVADAELLGDLLHVDGLALVGERGVARDHEEPAQLGQRGDDVLADAVGEILLLRIAAHVGEGQHGDGGPVGQRQGRARCSRLRPAGRRQVPARRRSTLRAHVADEAQALARDGADQLLVLAAVADRLARGVDAAGQGRIRHDAAAPDRRDEIVLADDAVAVLHQVDQQVEDLRLDGNGLRPAAQLAPVRVKRMVGKEKLHASTSWGRSHETIEPISRSVSRPGQSARAGRRLELSTRTVSTPPPTQAGYEPAPTLGPAKGSAATIRHQRRRPMRSGVIALAALLGMAPPPRPGTDVRRGHLRRPRPGNRSMLHLQLGYHTRSASRARS